MKAFDTFDSFLRNSVIDIVFFNIIFTTFLLFFNFNPFIFSLLFGMDLCQMTMLI